MIIITIMIMIIVTIITDIIMILTCSEGGTRGDQEAGDGRVKVAHPGVDPGVRGAVGVHREENCLRQAGLEESIYKLVHGVCMYVCHSVNFCCHKVSNLKELYSIQYFL